jgi:hypothetical protein
MASMSTMYYSTTIVDDTIDTDNEPYRSIHPSSIAPFLMRFTFVCLWVVMYDMLQRGGLMTHQ